LNNGGKCHLKKRDHVTIRGKIMPPLNGSQVTKIALIYDIEIQMLNYG
jgi:hypothetical protein